MALRDRADDHQDVSSPSARIHDLNSIDSEVSSALRSAGVALESLTGRRGDSEATTSKEEFEIQTKAFLRSVQAIGARLRRQAYALEEAGIIAAEASSDSQSTQQLAGSGFASSTQGTRAPPMQVTNGGFGNLDVGWLNSRRDNVGKQKEAELWAQARALLEQRNQSNGQNENEAKL